MSTTEFNTAIEPITSITHLSNHGGEAVTGPIVTGYYENGDGEIWLEQEGRRINIPAEHFRAVMKQLKRAHDIAHEDAAK
jgi:hypothetical protein